MPTFFELPESSGLNVVTGWPHGLMLKASPVGINPFLFGGIMDNISGYPDLIKNENTVINFEWDLWGAEVDLLAVHIKGEKQKLTQQEITDFLAGVLDSVVLAALSNANAREQAILAQQLDGKSADFIARYLKGWDSISSAMDILKNKGDKNGTI